MSNKIKVYVKLNKLDNEQAVKKALEEAQKRCREEDEFSSELITNVTLKMKPVIIVHDYMNNKTEYAYTFIVQKSETKK